MEPYHLAQDFEEPIDYKLSDAMTDCRHENQRQQDPYWIGVPNCRSRFTFRKQVRGRMSSDVHVSFDEVARRVVPTSKKDSSNQLLFFGCSYTWGEGVEDEETFANQVTSRLAIPVRAFNLSAMGWGPNHVLRLLQNRNEPRMKGIQPGSGVAIYTFIDDHIRRVFGNRETFRGPSHVNDPYYYLRDGRLVNGGSFESGRPLWSSILELLAHSELLSYFHIDLPLAGDQDFVLFAAIIREIRDTLKEKYGINTFIFSIFPGDNYYASRLLPLLQHEGVEVFDFSEVDIDGLMKGRNLLFGNYHPSPLSHRFYADLLVREMRKRSIQF